MKNTCKDHLVFSTLKVLLECSTQKLALCRGSRHLKHHIVGTSPVCKTVNQLVNPVVEHLADISTQISDNG